MDLFHKVIGQPQTVLIRFELLQYINHFEVMTHNSDLGRFITRTIKNDVFVGNPMLAFSD